MYIKTRSEIIKYSKTQMSFVMSICLQEARKWEHAPLLSIVIDTLIETFMINGILSVSLFRRAITVFIMMAREDQHYNERPISPNIKPDDIRSFMWDVAWNAYDIKEDAIVKWTAFNYDKYEEDED